MIPVWRGGDRTRFLLVQHNAGHWSFPKGHAQIGETAAEAALRELQEETGIADVELLTDRVFVEQYRKPAHDDPTTVVDKVVQYYIGLVRNPQTQAQLSEVRECRWSDFEEAEALITYDESRKVLREAAAALGLLP